MSKSANNLLKTAEEEGTLSKASAKALIVPDIGREIEAALGMNVDLFQASEVMLLTQMVDDSGSIAGCGNEQVMMHGHNLVLDALMASKQENKIMAHTKYLNGDILFPYSMLADAVRMDATNYRANGGTPLFDQSVLLLGTVLAKTQEFTDRNVQVKTMTLIPTDGNDEHSVRANPAMVASIVRDMQRSEDHIVCAMGIDDAPEECYSCGFDGLRDTETNIRNCPKCGADFHRTDFRKVFRSMGIEDNWILTPKNTESEIRKAFQVASKSAVSASKSAASFSKTAMGGFGG